MENLVKIVPATTSADVTAKRFGKYGTDGKVSQCGTSGEDADGVIRDTVTSGFSTGLIILGDPVEVTAGAAVSAGDVVQTDANGKAITQTTGKGLGRAQTAAAADGDTIEVQLFAKAVKPAAAIASLTDNSGGTANDTLQDVEATYTEATLANNFADLAAKINSILAALRKAGVIAP